jgi:hypothetical protein
MSLVFVIALAACSSTPSTGAASVSPTAAAVASASSEVASPATPEAATPGESPSAAPVVGGTATDFCGAFKELQALNDSPSGDVASMGAQLQAAAADVRKYAPAEIKDAANTYADVMDSIGKAAAGGSVDEAALQKAFADAIAGNAKDIGTTATWVATNCDL